jgi:ribosomal protein L12E/L44/L45/RPP1/RPP2
VGEVGAALGDLAGVNKAVQSLMQRGAVKMGSPAAAPAAKRWHNSQYQQQSSIAEEAVEEDNEEEEDDVASEFDDVVTTISDIFSTYRTPLASLAGWESPRTSCSGGTFAAGPGSSIFGGGGYHQNVRKDSIASSSIRRVDPSHTRKDSYASSIVMKRLEDTDVKVAPSEAPSPAAAAGCGGRAALMLTPELAAAAVAAGVLKHDAPEVLELLQQAGNRQGGSRNDVGSMTGAVGECIDSTAAGPTTLGLAVSGQRGHQQQQQQGDSCAAASTNSTLGDEEDFYSLANSTPRTSLDGPAISEHLHRALSGTLPSPAKLTSPACSSAETKLQLTPAAFAVMPSTASASASAVGGLPVSASAALTSAASASAADVQESPALGHRGCPRRASNATAMLDVPLKEVLGDLQHQMKGLKVEELLQQLEAAGVWVPIKVGKHY